MGAGSSSDEDQYSSKTRDSSPVKMKISVLVVDDDQICSAIVSSILRAEMHQAFTAKDPREALSILRRYQGSIDLVIADYHMSQMNGSDLQRKIDIEFKLPVVMMSADDNQNSIAVQSLINGAVFFIEKPVNPDDLKSIWQYAVATRRKRKSVSVLPVDVELSPPPPPPQDDEDHNKNKKSTAVANYKRGIVISGDDNQNINNNTTSTPDHHHHAQDDGCSTAPKKAKVVWTNSLHNRFLQAIRYIGLEKAVPKKILDVMDVPGLTRANVASHLQKYREFLRRIATKSANQQRCLKSSFANGHQFSTSPATDSSQSVSKPSLAAPGYSSTTQFTPSQYYGTNYIFNAAATPNNLNPSRQLQQPTTHDQFYTRTSSVPTASNPLGLFMNNSTTAFSSSTVPVNPALFPETPQPAGAAGSGRGLLTTSSMAPYSYSTGDYGPITNFMGSQYSANVYNINNGGLMSSTGGSSAIGGNMGFGNQYLGFGLNNSDTGEDDEVDYGIMSDDSFAIDNMFIMQQMEKLTVEDHDANFADQFFNNEMAPPTPKMLGTGGLPNPNLATRSNNGGEEMMDKRPDHENYSNMFMSMLLGNDQGYWDGQMLGEVGNKQVVTNSTAGAIIVPTILESGACPTISEASYNMFGYQQTNHGSQGNYGQVPNPSATEHGINATPNDQPFCSQPAGNQQVYNFYEDNEWELLEAFFRTDDDEEA